MLAFKDVVDDFVSLTPKAVEALASVHDGESFWVEPSEQSRKECERCFRDVLDALPMAWIAGGALRDFFQRKPLTTDIDCFFEFPADVLDGIRTIREAGADELYNTPRIAGFRLHGRHVQLVKQRHFESMEATIDEFDFTVCCAGIDHSGRVAMHPRFLEDLAAHRLAVHHMSTPTGTMARLPRYIKKGFIPDCGTLETIAVAMLDVDFDDPEQNELRWYRGGKQRPGRFDD